MDESTVFYMFNDYAWLKIVLFAVIIRVLMSITKTIEIKFTANIPENLLKIFVKVFISRTKNEKYDDYFLPSFLGFLELIILPSFIFMNWYGVIGIWIGIKTAAQWKNWVESRNAYNRFLIGNLLVMIFSYLLYLHYLG